jgi:hypothetical protein
VAYEKGFYFYVYLAPNYLKDKLGKSAFKYLKMCSEENYI